MTQVSRKGFRDKNGKRVVIVPKVPGATAGNLASFDTDGNLQDSGIDTGLVGKTKFLYRLGIVKSGGAYTWDTNTTQALLEEIYNSLENSPYDALPVRVQIPGFTYAGYAAKGQVTGLKEIDLYVGTIAFQVYYNTSTNLWGAPVIVKSAVVLDALKSTEQLSSGNDYRLITSGAVKKALADKKSLEDGEGNYTSIVRIGKINHGDDELDAVDVYGYDAIRLRTRSHNVYIDADNIDNLQRTLDGNVAIKHGSIYIERNENGTSFPIVSGNTVKAGLESFINNHPENVTFIEGIRVVDNYSGKYFNPTASISWSRRQLIPTKIDVVVYIGGTKKLTATATVPEDSLDTILWDSEWDFKDYSSVFSIVSNS